MKKILFVINLGLILAHISCNKKSLIEGQNRDGKLVQINKSISLKTPAVTTFTTTIDAISYSFSLQVQKFRATSTTSSYNINDSIQLITIFPAQNTTFSVRNNAVVNYGIGQTILDTPYVNVGQPYLLFGRKASPYTGSYVATSGNVILGGSVFMPQFNYSTDGFLAFRSAIATANSTTVYIYAWMHLIFSQDQLVIDQLGYRPVKPIAAGKIAE